MTKHIDDSLQDRVSSQNTQRKNGFTLAAEIISVFSILPIILLLCGIFMRIGQYKQMVDTACTQIEVNSKETRESLTIIRQDLAMVRERVSRIEGRQ